MLTPRSRLKRITLLGLSVNVGPVSWQSFLFLKVPYEITKNLQEEAKRMGLLEVQKHSNGGAEGSAEPANCLQSRHDNLSSILSPDIRISWCCGISLYSLCWSWL